MHSMKPLKHHTPISTFSKGLSKVLRRLNMKVLTLSYRTERCMLCFHRPQQFICIVLHGVPNGTTSQIVACGFWKARTSAQVAGSKQTTAESARARERERGREGGKGREEGDMKRKKQREMRIQRDLARCAGGGLLDWWAVYVRDVRQKQLLKKRARAQAWKE